jgi:hypothetical protein
MSYYAAGGYYEAGGFSLGKFGRWLGGVVKNPIITGLVGLVPGGSVALGGASLLAGATNSASIPSAVASGTAGTPGHNARASQVGRKTRRRRRSRW